jgi:hypothetical protein
MTVTRPDGSWIKTHIGLAMWARTHDGVEEHDEKKIFQLFEQRVGVTYDRAMMAYHSLPYRRAKAHPCGLKHLEEVGGYPGESFTICSKCKDVMDYHFNIGAVI